MKLFDNRVIFVILGLPYYLFFTYCQPHFMKIKRSIAVLLFSVTPVMLFLSLSRGNTSSLAIIKKIQSNFVSMDPADTEKHAPLVIPPPGPGTAILIADSSVVHDNYITIRVVSVLAYGSSTPALPKGTKINLQISGMLLKKRSIKDLCKAINTGKADTLSIHYSVISGVGVTDKHWTLNRIH